MHQSVPKIQEYILEGSAARCFSTTGSTSTGAGAEGSFTANEADMPRLEGELNISLAQLSEGSNLVVSGMYQESEIQAQANGGGGPEVEAHGVHIGGTLVGGPFAKNIGRTSTVVSLGFSG